MNPIRYCVLAGSVFTVGAASGAQQPAKVPAPVMPKESPVAAMRANVAFLQQLGEVQPEYQLACFEARGVTIDDWSKPDSSGVLRRFVNGVDTAPAHAKLSALRYGWNVASVRMRQKAICQYRYWSDLLDALAPVIDSGWMLIPIERYLERVTDSTKLPLRVAIAGLVKQSPTAARVQRLAVTLGDPNRYDAILANAGVDAHTQTYGYRNIKARAIVMLGRAYLKDRKIAQAERALAYARALVRTSDPQLGARIALAKHDTGTALREMAMCRIILSCFYSNHDAIQQFETLYKAVNKESLADADTMLLAAYRSSAFDLPISIVRRRPSVSPAGARRNAALVQFVTWIHCTPCAAHDYAARGLDQRFGDEVITLVYTYYPPLTPIGYHMADGRTEKEGFESDLFSWYKHMNATSLQFDQKAPTHCNGMIVDGTCVQTPSDIEIEGGKDAASLRYDETTATIEKRLAVIAPLALSGFAWWDGDHVNTTVNVSASAGATPVDAARKLKLHIVLVEDSVLVPGSNDPIQRHLVRAMAGDSTSDFGLTLVAPTTAGEIKTESATFDIPSIEAAIRRRAAEDKDLQEPEWVTRHAFSVQRSHLAVVAYVQDQANGEVLQAVRIYVGRDS